MLSSLLSDDDGEAKNLLLFFHLTVSWAKGTKFLLGKDSINLWIHRTFCLPYFSFPFTIMLHCAYDDDNDVVIREVTTNDRNQRLKFIDGYPWRIKLRHDVSLWHGNVHEYIIFLVDLVRRKFNKTWLDIEKVGWLEKFYEGENQDFLF